MSGVIGEVADVLHLVKGAYQLVRKIKDCPPMMKRIGEHLELVQLDLARIHAFLSTTPVSEQGSRVLLCLIERIREDSEDVTTAFHKYNKSNKPLKAFFVISGSQDDLVELRNTIDANRAELSREMLYMGSAFGIDKFGMPEQPQLPHAEEPSKAQASPARNDYSILFVDPYNVNRSVVAEGYAKLLKGWTTGTGGEWRFQLMHSCGLFVSSRSGVTDVLENMEYTYPSYKLSMKEGNKLPDATALDALFDNKMFNYAYKQDVQRHLEVRRSRGMAKTFFKTYDFVVAFTDREYDNLMRLRRALIAQEGRHVITGGGKGQIIHLGGYLRGVKKGNKPREILLPAGDGTREKWNTTVGQVKTAFKRFLKEEMDWKQPERGAKVST